jgi:glycosyltransferase involved in cell wall biosynthesis
MAKPLVTTNVPGCKDTVNDGESGYLCDVKDSNDLARQMEKVLLLSEYERKIMGNKGRKKIITEFDEKLVIEKYKKAIAAII